jgi:anti-sigma regulatory factor (Ser/Thr protein kinase)
MYTAPFVKRRADVVDGSRHAGCYPEPDSGVCPAANHGKQRIVTMNDWPLRSYLPLGALPSAVPCARLHAKHVLWEWGLAGLSDSAELIVSELTTNAVAVSQRLIGSRYDGKWQPGVPPVRLSLYSDKARVVVEVWDADDRMPEAQDIDLEAESGRGLLLVATLSTEWGIYRPEGASGKCVWAAV